MVFLDANLILETILRNRKKDKKVEDFIIQSSTPAISLLTIHLVFHFGLKEKIQKTILQDIVDQYEILDFTSEDYYWARQHCVDDDFEDALQVAVAVNNDCESFATLDKDLAKNYKKFINMDLI